MEDKEIIEQLHNYYRQLVHYSFDINKSHGESEEKVARDAFDYQQNYLDELFLRWIKNQ